MNSVVCRFRSVIFGAFSFVVQTRFFSLSALAASAALISGCASMDKVGGGGWEESDVASSASSASDDQPFGLLGGLFGRDSESSDARSISGEDGFFSDLLAEGAYEESLEPTDDGSPVQVGATAYGDSAIPPSRVPSDLIGGSEVSADSADSSSSESGGFLSDVFGGVFGGSEESSSSVADVSSSSASGVEGEGRTLADFLDDVMASDAMDDSVEDSSSVASSSSSSAELETRYGFGSAQPVEESVSSSSDSASESGDDVFSGVGRAFGNLFGGDESADSDSDSDSVSASASADAASGSDGDRETVASFFDNLLGGGSDASDVSSSSSSDDSSSSAASDDDDPLASLLRQAGLSDDSSSSSSSSPSDDAPIVIGNLSGMTRSLPPTPSPSDEVSGEESVASAESDSSDDSSSESGGGLLGGLNLDLFGGGSESSEDSESSAVAEGDETEVSSDDSEDSSEGEGTARIGDFFGSLFEGEKVPTPPKAETATASSEDPIAVGESAADAQAALEDGESSDGETAETAESATSESRPIGEEVADFFGRAFGGAAPPPGSEDESEGTRAARLYTAALDRLEDGSYRRAAEEFEDLERQHPYSVLASQAILMNAYSHYRRNAYDDSVASAERFLSLHPGHENAPYAYYLIGMSYYERIRDIRRDQELTRQALRSLSETDQRFPDSPYAADAREKIRLVADHLAGQEMEVGRYYLQREAYVAAINRFKKVIDDYQTTTHTPEALLRLAEAYMALGIRSEAQTATALLGHNYPDSEWYRDAYALLQSDGIAPRENRESWLSRALRQARTVTLF